MAAESDQCQAVFAGTEAAQPSCHELASGMAVVYSARSPGKEGENEDAALLLPIDSDRGLLAVADGVGGSASGARASQIAVESLASAVGETLAAGGEIREGILNGFEAANDSVTSLGIGAATTLAAAEIRDNVIRSYHTGDSMVLLVGQRGKLKLQTVAHSPVGYAVEAGMLETEEAMHHEDRHIVSNMVGSPEMRVEVGSILKLSPHDTLLLASDGLFDNLLVDEIVEHVRRWPLDRIARSLVEICTRRMQHPPEGLPSKPDDLTFILFRRRMRKQRAEEPRT